MTTDFWPEAATLPELPPLDLSDLDELKPLAVPLEVGRVRNDVSQVLTAMEAAADMHHREGKYELAAELGRFSLDLKAIVQ